MKPLRDIFLNTKIKRMTEYNQNFLSVTVGPTGSGKTYATIALADEMMGGKFDPDFHLVLTNEEFVERLPKFKKGDIIVFEEAGVNISSKKWQSKANRNIGFVLQTCRHRNFGVMFTLPMFDFLDKVAREHTHTIFMTKYIDRKKDIAWLKVYDFKIDPYKGTTPYRIIPKFWVDGVLVAMPHIAVKKPREDLIINYEKRKKEFTDALYKQIELELQHEKTQENKKMNKGSPCPICSLSSWEYRKKEKLWLCRKCGYQNYVNPYVKN